MEQTRRRVVARAGVPVVMALILFYQTINRPSMAGVHTVDILSLLISGALLGIVISLIVSAFRQPK